jgi:hypothetical protein
MPVLFDEYQKLNGNKKYCVKMAVEILSFMRSMKGKLVFIPVLDGTTEKDATTDADLSDFGIHTFGLGPLEEGEDMEIVKAHLGGSTVGEKWCRVAVESLGRIPRFIELFLKACKTPIGLDLRDYFEKILKEVSPI